MELAGETLIAAPIGKVWAGLNDPAILRACIPGCEALEQTSPTEMTARVVQKIGPVSASFSGQITLSDLDPPNAYRITGQGSGGVAGFAKGAALIRLREEPEGTRLTYTVEVTLGGKIAQLGARMIKGLADSLAAQFFERFSQAVTGQSPQPAGQPAGQVAVRTAVASHKAGAASDGPGWRIFALAGWATAAVFAILALILATRH